MFSSISPSDLNLTSFTLILFLSLFISKMLFNSRRRNKVYLVDFTCFKPPNSQQVSRERAVIRLEQHVKNFTPETIQFQRKASMASGIGDFTYVPQSLLNDPMDFSMEAARIEAQGTLYGAVGDLLAKTGVKVENIGILIVCCSLFNPAPSLSSIIVNRFKLRHDIKSINLSGMGCTAAVEAIGLAKHLLQVNHNTYAMVVSTEIIGPNTYRGNDMNKLVINCVFRVGGAAILLSNRPSDRHSSKYQLTRAVCTNTTSSDTSYKCIYQEEDSQGLAGVTVTRDLLVEARKAITSHMTTLAKLVLPTSVQILFGLNCLIRRLNLANLKPYNPDFKRATEHFFPHVGASAVIDEVERNLKLDVEAPRMTLYRFGNLSSSTVWYELAYAEAKERIEKGDRVWQIAFGAGFKCSSIIWHAMKRVDREKINPWFDEIDNFPTHEKFETTPHFKETGS